MVSSRKFFASLESSTQVGATRNLQMETAERNFTVRVILGATRWVQSFTPAGWKSKWFITFLNKQARSGPAEEEREEE